MTKELSRKYDPAVAESSVNEKWHAAHAFHAEPDVPGAPYSIVIPPPNVTSALHMGHALNNTLQDILIRWRRMEGRNTLWMPGTDHAGIATQTVVEKRVLAEEGKRRTDYGRDAFVAKIQAWKDEYEERITDQLKAMGCSCDWDRQRFTMDPVCTRAVREAFFRLFKAGLIYRGKRLVNWDPATQTALADDEVEMRQIDGHFWYLKYPLVEERNGPAGPLRHVIVATTRPETMLGDTAVAVHPKDPRATALRGAKVRLPIVNRIIPVIEDEYVVLPDPQSSDDKARYSSGFLKITPAHDPNDWEVWRRHEKQIPLGAINVLSPDGTISKDHGWPAEEFESGQAEEVECLLGLTREDACAAVVEWFKKHDLLEQVKPYQHAVGHSYRSHVPIEPYLSDQWYVAVTDDRLAGAALRAMAGNPRTTGDDAPPRDDTERTEEGRRWEGKLRFFPERYAKTYQDWHENIRDWCISRQLWWGHRIPVWSKEVLEPKSATPSLLTLTARLDQHPAAEIRGHGLVTRSAIDVHRLAETKFSEPYQLFVCLQEDDPDLTSRIESEGFDRDPDVLDTWFSSALWPISTMGWPNETDNRVLEKWNPSHTLCTAREIITLWISRMVMFNLFLRDCLPFTDVFIHAMIQDGHGQKMSKSLGNGVDPFDIIHSHGADAMRFTLASMTTQTQDVRLPVDLICPYTGVTFTPRFTTDRAGHHVADPIQSCPSNSRKKMVSSYGAIVGQATPSDELPLARNTSEKFDLGRNFANKLWNAVRFALGHLDVDIHGDGELSLADRWILSRLTATTRTTTDSLAAYEFKHYADGLYDFIWRDFCDWYIEALKPTIQDSPMQRRVLAVVLDVTLRLLHPVMPYITEVLWERLNELAAERTLDGIEIPPHALLVHAQWPKLSAARQDPQAEADFAHIQEVVTAIRQIRTTYKVAPRETIASSAKASRSMVDATRPHASLIRALTNASAFEIGTDTVAPEDAVTSVVNNCEIYVHGLVNHEEEQQRLSKRLAQVQNDMGSLQKRLRNKGYTEKAPSHLVEETRSQLDAAEKEARALEQQLAALG